MRANLHSSSFVLIAGILAFSSCMSTPRVSAAAAVSGKAEPEDLRPWPKEPFKKIEAPKAFSGMPGSPGSLSELVIQGIMKIDKRYYAIINGRTVKAGDRIDEWTITGISRHRVTASREKELQTFDIYQGRINRGTK